MQQLLKAWACADGIEDRVVDRFIGWPDIMDIRRVLECTNRPDSVTSAKGCECTRSRDHPWFSVPPFQLTHSLVRTGGVTSRREKIQREMLITAESPLVVPRAGDVS